MKVKIINISIKDMNYYFNKTVNMDFEQAVQLVTEELKTEGFGVLTEIDIKVKLERVIASL